MQIFQGEICHELAILPIYLGVGTIVINDGVVKRISIESIKIIFIFVQVVLKESSL